MMNLRASRRPPGAMSDVRSYFGVVAAVVCVTNLLAARLSAEGGSHTGCHGGGY